MAREDYQHSLSELRGNVFGMGETVRHRVDDALDAMASGDADLARQVAEGDDEIDRTFLDLEGECIDLFALQQPVAGDLRFVAASFKILSDLERVGDLAANLGRYTLAAEREQAPDVDVVDIGRTANGMVADALDAYAAADATACKAIAERDDQVDALCQRASEQVVRDLIGRRAAESDLDSWGVERVLDDVSRILLTVRDIERIADHAVNVAARTRYAVEGDPDLI